jgi:exosortase/archaeosortase family protein
MIDRRAAPDRLPIPRQIFPAVTAGLVLFAGFIFLQTPPLIAAFRAVAELLALCAASVLRATGGDILRTGIEIRDTVRGHAIAVTQACDGSSLVLASLAVAIWLWRGGRRDLLLVAVAAVIAIFAFNLLRVLLLFGSIGTPVLLEVQHLYVAPLLSAALVSGIVIVGFGISLREMVAGPVAWLAFAAGVAIVWYPLTTLVTCNSAVPLANTWLWLFPGELERAVVCRTSDAIVSTTAVVGLDPVRVLDVPFYPTDFTLAAPLVIASLAMHRRFFPILGGALAALLLFSLAMALGAVSASQDAATAGKVELLMGLGWRIPFVPMNESALAALKAAQNAVVHFNLFLLPLALLPPPATAAAPTTARPRGRGRGRQQGRTRQR